ncbi:PIN domain-containing protein [Rathayibacter sp. PhB152]|uniref:PIN domain-containing protein n=1 Tax=Rathayibacter sp. PhB152 TaxID=2485190 RepID=UPI000F4C2A79|nr:PIN domain-containing protein [Rathayibacter sp. PhB152]
MPAGRPALPRNVYSYEDPALVLPAEVALDTSFVVNVLVTTEPLHAASLGFMLDLVENNSTVFYNRLLELELAEIAFKIAVKEQHGAKAWPRLRADGRVRRRAGRLCKELFDAWGDLLTTVPHLRVELDEVADLVLTTMTAYGLASYDAAHAATAAYVGANGLVANDAGFGQVDAAELALYVDASRVRSCRRRRGGR